MTVVNKLKPGLNEKFYEKALIIELQKLGLSIKTQQPYPVFYDGVLLGDLVPDFVVEDKVIVDTKCVTQFNDSHLAQMIGYLAITNLQLALLLNFKYAKFGWKRVVR